jgi:transposase
MIIDLWEQLDNISNLIEIIKKRMLNESKEFPETKLLKTIPGIGPIHSATISAFIETPIRFANHKKLWKYAGYGLIKKTSGNSLHIEKRSTAYNRTLKWAVKQAINSIINSKNNSLNQYYLKLIYAGVHPKKVNLILCRKLLTTIYIMWKKGVPYRNNYSA